MGFTGGSDDKASTYNVETWVRSLGWEDPLKKEMPTHSSNFAWIIPMDREACWATVHWVSKSQTWLNS